jgi:hypothetical protein
MLHKGNLHSLKPINLSAVCMCDSLLHKVLVFPLQFCLHFTSFNRTTALYNLKGSDLYNRMKPRSRCKTGITCLNVLTKCAY